MIKIYYRHGVLFLSILTLSVANVAFASHGGFHALVGIPGVANPDALTTEGYVQALYDISITAAALLVVFKLMLAGVQYMFTDVVTSKEAAKKDIRASLVGLLIILAAVTLLNTINPNLTTLNFLKNADPANVSIKRVGPRPDKNTNAAACEGTQCSGGGAAGGSGGAY